MEELLRRLERADWYRGQVRAVVEVSARSARLAPPPSSLPVPAQAWLEAQGISLFSHQVEAMEKILAGQDVILATGPSSGKTLALALPILAHLAQEPQATALLLYPLKALTQDQLGKWQGFGQALGVTSLGIYDGDTPTHLRRRLREQARILLTNPYALHQYLEWHHLWAPFLAHLRYVVIDEAHWYQGVFGAGVALLLWRLRRILARYGAHPIFALASATCGDPQGLAGKLVGRPVQVVDEDGSPQGRRTWWFWDPDRDEVSPFSQGIRLCQALLREGLQVLVFVPSRAMSEAMAAALKELCPAHRDQIAAYRAGYLPAERRAVEEGLRQGKLRVVVSTRALELGVDIGGLDATVLWGYPGSLASVRQMSGRAGRAGREALLVYIPEEDPLDRFFLAHPEELVFGSVEVPALNPRHRELVARHLLCAAAEIPLTPGEIENLGLGEEDLSQPVSAGLLARTPAGWTYAGLARPAEKVALDTLSGRQVVLEVEGRALEIWDEFRARREAFPGAVILHQGERFCVQALDLQNGVAQLRPHTEEYTTKPETRETVHILRYEEMGRGLGRGWVRVREEVVGYKLLQRGCVLARRPLELPPLEYETEGVWLVWEGGGVSAGALHGAEHALVATVPLVVGCAAADVGGVSTPVHPETGLPTLLVYDAFPGGLGVSRVLFAQAREWVEKTAALLASCPCQEGCPRCVLSPRCGSGNQPMDKRGAWKILEAWAEKYGALG